MTETPRNKAPFRKMHPFAGGSLSQMEGFQAEDRHDPLPHITLLTTAPKSVYRKMTSLVTHPAPELGELQIPGGPE
jgi:hypothetical protein